MNTRASIIIIEDEKNICNFIETVLPPQNYQVTCAYTGTDGLKLINTHKPDVVLLDLGLPDMDGLEIIQEVRTYSSVPIIVISARTMERSKVAALDMGADDYLTKPFEIVELLARVEAVLRRYHKTETVLNIFDVVIDTASRSVMQNGEPVSLTMKEFDLLLLLARNRNIALYRETIYETVWGGEYMGQSRTVDLHIQRLKKKLNWDNEIAAVYKVGYRLEGEEKMTR